MKIDIHTHRSASSADILSVRNLMPNDYASPAPYASVGLHPWHIGEDWPAAMELVRSKATAENILMIGECGLDKLHAAGGIETQKEAFIQQIELSESIGKPLIIHCVKSFDEIIAIRKDTRPKQQWIIHGFRGKPQQAQQLLDNGFHLSFGERFNPGSLALAYQSNCLWLETDESTLDIRQIYSQAADSLNIAEPILEERIESNASRLLGIPHRR
jgi:TatD DNase family protein